PTFHLSPKPRALLSFPTRRSSDLIGTLATLVAWGALVDRLGERISLLTGLTVLVAGAAVTVIGARAGSTLALGLGFALCGVAARSEEHTSELQSREKLVCRLLLEK